MTIATYSSDVARNLVNFAYDLQDDNHNCDGSLKSLTEQILDDTFGFVRVGIAAQAVRSRKLWKRNDEYTDWKHYCVKALGRTSWSIDRTIDASKVVMKLIEMGHKVLPICEAQCRPLVSLLANFSDKLSDIWEQVTSEYLPEGITAMKIDSIANPDRQAPEAKLSKGAMRRLAKVAKDRGYSPEELLDELLNEVEEPAVELEPISPNLEPIPADIAQMMDDLDLKFAAQTAPNPSTKPTSNPPMTIKDKGDAIGKAFDDLMSGLMSGRVRSNWG